MARPKKPARLKKDVDLRIPVTKDERARIHDALDGVEFAGWAREVLFSAADRLVKQKAGSSKKRGKSA